MGAWLSKLLALQLIVLQPTHSLSYWLNTWSDKWEAILTAECQTIPISYNFCIQKYFLAFSSYFLTFITDFKHTIIISYALLTNNTLINLNHPLWNLKPVTFFIISLQNASKSFPFCFRIDLVNSSPRLFLYFKKMFLSVSLFPSFLWFTLLTNSITNIIIPLQGLI